MAFLPKTTAPHLLLAPEGWNRFSLEEDPARLSAQAKEIARSSVSAEVPRDKRPLVIERIHRYVLDALLDARAQGMLGVTLPVRSYASESSLPVSVTDFEYDTSDDRDGGLTLSMLRAGMIRGGRASEMVDLRSGLKAVRTLAVDAAPEIDGQRLPGRSTTLLFAMPIPRHSERWKGVQFTFTVADHIPTKVDRAYLAIADVMIQSFRFIDADGPADAQLEERIAELIDEQNAAHSTAAARQE